MIRNVVQRFCATENRLILLRNKTTSAVVKEYDIEEIEDTEEVDDNLQNEELIQKKRNKSRLSPQHYNVLHGNKPYSSPTAEYHNTVKYHRKMFAVYGESSGVDPKVCWPSAEMIEATQEYEQVAFPYTIQQLMKENAEKKKDFEEQRRKRQEDIVKKFSKLEQWKKELREKIEKREAEARAVKERKDRLVEEVRRHFGFKIDPRDERFKEMLEQKERAEKKLMKEAKRKVKEARLIAKLQEPKNTEPGTKPPTEVA